MAGDFSSGLEAGFSLIDSIRDRADQRALQARQMSLAEIASNRAGEVLKANMADRAHAYANESDLKRTLAARARVAANPDSPNQEDLDILTQGGDSQTIEALQNYKARSAFVSGSLRDLAAQGPQIAGTTAQQGAPAAGQQGGPVNFSADQTAFLGPNAETQLPGDQFPQPRSVPIGEVKGFLPEDDPALKAANLGELRNANRMPGPSTMAVDIPPGVLTASEIQKLPLTEQDAARQRNKELLGNRAAAVETLRGPDKAAAKKSMQTNYADFLDTNKDSSLRSMAATQPTAFIAQYRKERASLDPNTRALMDAKIPEISNQSLANLLSQAPTIPLRADGTPDANSEEYKNYKAGVEHNIALRAAADKEFSASDVAKIRGGFMPVGNPQLVQRVADAWSQQPTPANPATSTERRLFNTDISRLAAAPNGVKKVSSATIDRLGKAVARGWIDQKEAESLLTTGKVTPPMLAFHEHDTKNDLYLNGQLISRGEDPELVLKYKSKMNDDGRKYLDQFFEESYGGNTPAQTEERARRKNQFMTWVMNDRQKIMDEHGFDPLNTDIPHLAALANTFRAQDAATDVWSKSWLGLKQAMFGSFGEQAPRGSDEIAGLERDLLGPNYGVTTLGKQQLNAVLARSRLLKSGNPEYRALAIQTMGNDQALGQALLKIQQQQQQGQ
jgi:hypothetical protein